jgi:glycosyltransferase involved in cell wall biosynthesis
MWTDRELAARGTADVDVALIVEGCYPFVPGGVSGWIDWLIRTRPETSFAVIALWPRPTDEKPRYQLPANVRRFETVYLQRFGAAPGGRLRNPQRLETMAAALDDFLSIGGANAFARVLDELSSLRQLGSPAQLFNSEAGWAIAELMYQRRMPYGSFLHYFWAWRALLGGVFATLDFELPRARAYHAISTGYAGVLAARAALETGRPALLTEHGIYTNERRIELLMADWVTDTIDKGHALADHRRDLRDMWIEAFEAFSRTCYDACANVITLYEDNQSVQRALGAQDRGLAVIANGIDVARFKDVVPAADDARPTIALIGRVVPIKDVKAYIAAAHILRQRIADLRAFILGPLDEDPEYTAECQALVAELGLETTVEFTGAVDVAAYLSRIHVVVLTSLSESQPLVLLEAGAAGVPFVATNVGSCREIIEGRSDESPQLGQGGIVTGLVAPVEIADACQRLLTDHALRHRYGETLKARVSRIYTSERAAAAYTDLYRRALALPSKAPLVRGSFVRRAG